MMTMTKLINTSITSQSYFIFYGEKLKIYLLITSDIQYRVLFYYGSIGGLRYNDSVTMMILTWGNEVVVVWPPNRVQLFATPWTAASLSLTISQSLPKFMSTELVMPSNHLILCHLLLLLPSIFPSIRVFSKESHQVAKVLELQLQYKSFQWILKVDFF